MQSSTITKREEIRRKTTATPSPPECRQPVPKKKKQESATGQEQAPQDETRRPTFCYSYCGERCLKDENCDHWHPPFCVLFKRDLRRAGVNCPFVHLSKGDGAPCPKRTPKEDKVKDSCANAKQMKAGGNSLQECALVKASIHAKGNPQVFREKRNLHTSSVVRLRHAGRLFPRSEPKSWCFAKRNCHEKPTTTPDVEGQGQIPRGLGTTQRVDISQLHKTKGSQSAVRTSSEDTLQSKKRHM